MTAGDGLRNRVREFRRSGSEGADGGVAGMLGQLDLAWNRGGEGETNFRAGQLDVVLMEVVLAFRRTDRHQHDLCAKRDVECLNLARISVAEDFPGCGNRAGRRRG